MKRYDAFVSYSRIDEKLMNPVVKFIAIGKRKVFCDVRDIEPGERWADKIEQAVRDSSTVIVLWCCHSAQSEWVRHETAIATAASIPLVPVLLCPHPAPSPLSDYQWIDYRDSIRHDCLPPGGPAKDNPASPVPSALPGAVGLESFAPDNVDRVSAGVLGVSAASLRLHFMPLDYSQKLLILTIEAIIRLKEDLPDVLPRTIRREKALAAGEVYFRNEDGP